MRASFFLSWAVLAAAAVAGTACNAIVGIEDHSLATDAILDGGSDSPTSSDAFAGADARASSDAVADAGACVDKSLRCEALQPQTCVGGSFRNLGSACPFVCSGGTCTGLCNPGSLQCASDSDVQACAASGDWGAPTACPSPSSFCNGGLCGVCKSGSTKCSGNGVQTCDATGAWGAAAACQSTCAAGACTGVCIPSTTRCAPPPRTTVHQTCNASGSWVDDPITSGTCGAICTPGGQAQCNGVVPQTCNATGTAWQNGSVTAGQCGCTCTPGANRCNGTTPQQCSSTCGWQNGSISAGNCGAVCTPGASQCSGPTPQTCNSIGTGWQNGAITQGVCGAACTPGSVLCGLDGHGTCPPGSGEGCWWGWTAPGNVYLQACDANGQWGLKSYCTSTCQMTGGRGPLYECRTTNGINVCSTGTCIGP